MRYVVFNDRGFIEGLYLEEFSPIPEGSDYALISDELCFALASKDSKALVKKSIEIDRERVYETIEELVEENTEIDVVIVDDYIDEEKLALAEAIADLYEQLLIIQGGM